METRNPTVVVEDPDPGTDDPDGVVFRVTVKRRKNFLSFTNVDSSVKSDKGRTS